jgi:YVTN family beta-propeller protein
VRDSTTRAETAEDLGEQPVQISQEPVHVRRRRVAVSALVLIVILIVLLASCMSGGPGTPQAGGTAPHAAAGGAPDGTPSQEPTSTPSSTPEPPEHPSATTRLKQVDKITGAITPKSVVANGKGLVIANNMMYSHTMTLYDAGSRKLEATIPDSVDLSELGVKGHPGTSKGAPVEAAFTKDGRYAYVSQYSMYGSGFGPHGVDVCKPSDGYDASFVYRVDTTTMKVDQAIQVGAVPKYVAITPDQKTVLVTNWCDYTMSIIDRAAAKVVDTVHIGPMPRGLAITPDGKNPNVTAMWTDHVYRVDLAHLPKQAPVFASPGGRMRHLDVSPDGKFLYAVSSDANSVSKIDAQTGKILDEATVGQDPRSMAISPDGTALYVVNYDVASMSKIRTSDMKVLQTLPTAAHPIGITYEPTTQTVWVANYGGSILVFDDTDVT